jgi:cystinosin
MSVLEVFAQILGWCYLFCWSFCNLPQLILIHRRKSVAGFSITFQVLNMLGFLWYFIYLVYGYIYQHRHDTTKSIVWQDFCWCGITLIVVYGIAIQCLLYRRTITESVHPFYQLSMFGILIITLYNAFLVRAGFLQWYIVSDNDPGSGSSGADAFSFMHFLGYSKTFISFIKYVPQCKLNFTRKATTGFSIQQVLLDVGGAVTSFGQSMLNAYINPQPDGSPDWNTVFGNVPKLLLSLESIFFCSILIVQHYWLYAEENERIAAQMDLEDGGAGNDNNNDHDGGEDIAGVHMQFECDDNGQCRIINLGGKQQQQQQNSSSSSIHKVQQSPSTLHYPTPSKQERGRDDSGGGGIGDSSGNKNNNSHIRNNSGTTTTNNNKNKKNDNNHHRNLEEEDDGDDSDGSDNPLLSLLDDRSPVAKQSDDRTGFDDGDEDDGGGGVNLRTSSDITLDIQSMKTTPHRGYS